MAVSRAFRLVVCVASLLALAVGSAGGAGAAPPPDRDDVVAHWTPQRIMQAQPRDLVLDHRGLGYLRRKDGSLQPHGHSTPAQPAPVRSTPIPGAKPSSPGGGGGGSNDTTPPEIGARTPVSGAQVGAEQQFTAVVTDAGSGVKSVTFIVTKGSTSWSFTGTHVGDDTWVVNLVNFTDGEWTWHLVAVDKAKKGGNSTEADPWPFTVSTSAPPPPPPAGTVTNSPWADRGAVQTAVGRIYFEMPANKAKTRWSGYVCSGSVGTDETDGRSIVITAAHCVYDDVNKAFARNVLFIPNQAETTGSGTDRVCTNDPLGCWTASHGVVDAQWSSRTWPANIPWDYAYYVVGDEGAHTAGFTPGTSAVLDVAAGSLPIQFTAPSLGDHTHALGYSYSEDPKLMYCAEGLAEESAYSDWWLGSCDLSGGSSGGPWIQPLDTSTGHGPIVSVNSWGYRNQSGMAGPKLTGSASRLFDQAKVVTADTIVP